MSPSSDELLTEVRGLRADVNQALSGSIRAQLLVGRLQLQEQRINIVNGQLMEVRNLLTSKQTAQAREAVRLKDLENALESPDRQHERTQIERMLRELKASLAQGQTEVQQLRSQEAELSSRLASENGRWNSFNDRLDEIERSLPGTMPNK